MGSGAEQTAEVIKLSRRRQDEGETKEKKIVHEKEEGGTGWISSV